MGALAGWSDIEGQTQFAAALRNLLFSHGLAEDVVLLTVQEDLLADESQAWAIPHDGSLAQQVAAATLPLTMIDILDRDLSTAETTLLEELTPTLLLPVLRGDRLEAIVLLIRSDGNFEYSVAEHFALELLMRTLSGERPDARRGVPGADEALGASASSISATPGKGIAAVQTQQSGARSGSATSNVLLSLALNLPEADDRPHFWRLFARVTSIPFCPYVASVF